MKEMTKQITKQISKQKEDKNTIIFDLDGTLLDTIADLTDSVNYVMEQYGFPIYTIPQIKSFVGNGIRRLMINAVPLGEEDPHFEEAFALFKSYYQDHCMVKTKPYEGIPELLAKCRQRNYNIAIVSNKNQEAVTRLCKHFFAKDVSVAIGQKEGVRKKPYPDSVLAALDQLGADRKQSVYVGDSEVDAETSQNADMDGILVSWGFRDRALLESLHPRAIADQPLDILDILKE